MSLFAASRNAQVLRPTPSCAACDMQPVSRFFGLIGALAARLLRRPIQRRIVCFAVAFNLLLWPGPGAVAHYLFDSVSQGASTILNARLLSSSYEAYFIKRLLSRSAQTPRRDTPADRVAVVAQLHLNPARLVAYLVPYALYGRLWRSFAGA
jgi:hypothetical protein